MDMVGKYIPRLIDSELRAELRLFGAVLIVGPKWCGKTTSAEQIAASAIYMQDEDRSEEYIKIANMKPSNILIGEKPRLIDEWQAAPKLWGAVRFDVDKQNKEGLYILTGSTTVDEVSIPHSGTGRISRLRMRTMSLFESGYSTGDVCLSDLFDRSSEINGHSDLDYTKLAEMTIRGGWPRSIGKSTDDARKQVARYCEMILRSEINLPDGKRRDEQRMRKILRSLSRNVSTSVSNTTILKDISSDGSEISINTLSDYIKALRDIYVVEDLDAWSPKLRSKTAIRTSPTRHFTDPAIAAYFLNANPFDLEMDPRTFGLLFESLVVRDLRVYAQAMDGDVYHYRDENGLEADAIIHLHNGKWCALEIKLGSDSIDNAAKNLLRLADKIDTDFMNPPSFLAVITGTEFAYTRDDGVHVIPLGCLKN